MEPLLDVEDIRTLLPHRYPLLLVDRVLELEPGVRIVGLKNVTVNEPFFVGHFPSQAVMPGVLICEAMAQVAGLMILSMPEHADKLAFIGAMNNVRFRLPVVPGDTLLTEATLVKIRRTVAVVRMVSSVEGKVVAECDMTFALKERIREDAVYAKLDRIRSRYNGNGAIENGAIEEVKEDAAYGSHGQVSGTAAIPGDYARD